MKVNNPTIKSGLSLFERIEMTRYIADGYFVDGDYTPYYADIHKLIAFFLYCVDGIEFEKDENIYNAVMSDEKLMYLYSVGMNINSIIYSDLETVNRYVEDIVEFEKKKMLIESSQVIKKLNEILDKESRNKDEELRLTKQMEKIAEKNEQQIEINNKVSELLTPEETASLLKKFNSPEFNAENIAKSVSDSYMESMLRENKNKDLVQDDNEKIVEFESHNDK